MIKDSKFYKEWTKLKSDLKPMTFRQKLDHLWTYYKEFVWLGAVVVLVLGVVIGSVINGSKDVLVSGMYVNITMDAEGFEYMDSEYFQALGGDPKKHVEGLIEYSNFTDLEDPTNHEDQNTQMMILWARVEGEYMDYGLLDQLALEHYMPNEFFKDLRELFSEEMLQSLGNKVIWAKEKNSEEAIPLAINIADLPFAKDNHLNNGEPAYFVVSTRTKRPEMCIDAWNRINAWEGKK